MFDKINGLPGHVLLIHAVVVLVPLAALSLVLFVAWPVARARLGIVSPLLALVALVLIPITTSAGEWLRDHLGFTDAAIRKHTELGATLLPWVIAVFVLSVGSYVAARFVEFSWRPVAADPEPAGGGGTATAVRTKTQLPVWVMAIVTVVCAAVAVGTLITLYRIGDSGAHAVWNGRTQ